MPVMFRKLRYGERGLQARVVNAGLQNNAGRGLSGVECSGKIFHRAEHDPTINVFSAGPIAPAEFSDLSSTSPP
jgi:hypothetical protein